jgi:NAD-dependent deacetylase
MEVAAGIAADADIFIVAGTSMVVYPAAGLIDYVKPEVPKYVVDPNKPQLTRFRNVTFITEKASTGMLKLRDLLQTK